MVDDQSWDAKRDEIWRRIVGVENALKELTKGLSSVKALAESRVSADEKLVNDAAKKAVDGAQQVQGAVEAVASLSGDIERLKSLIPDVVNKVGQLNAFHEDGAQDRDNCASILKEVQALRENVIRVLDVAKKHGDEVSAKATLVDQQVQGAKELKSQISSDAAAVRTNRDEAAELKVELQNSKNAFDGVLADAQSKLTELYDTNQDGLNALIKGKTEELDELQKTKGDELAGIIEKYTADNEKLLSERKAAFEKIAQETKVTFSELRNQIEMLLPGATSAGLASAFLERKMTLQRTKRFWILGLLYSIAGLIFFGYLTSQGILSGSNEIASFVGRSIIVIGLIFAEEFCRRNYNIAARLTEAYAYKEVLSKSYLGYKKEMASMPMPKETKSDPENKGSSVLMSTLLDKLGKDPGDDVFDKERQIIGIGSVIDAMQNKSKGKDSPAGGQDSSGSINAQLPTGKFAAKVTWPVVVFAGVVVVAICVLLCFFITYGVIGGNECLDVNRSSKNRPLVHAQIGDGAAIGAGIGNKAMTVTKP